MAVLRIMNSRGDRSVRWDRDKVEAGDPDAAAAVREAERLFREARARGATGFRVIPGQPAERIDLFDSEAEQIVVVPQVAGG
jgi:hypothetical protein